MKVILGLSIFGHDSSAAVVNMETGEVVFALAEERLSNNKHSKYFPIGTIEKSLNLIKNNKYTLESIAINFDPIFFIKHTLSSEITRIYPNEKSKSLIDEIVNLFEFNEYLNINSGFIRNAFDDILSRYELKQFQKEEILSRSYCYFNWAVQKEKTINLVKKIIPNVPIIKVIHHDAHAYNAYLNSGFENATIITMDGQGESETLTVSRATKGGIEKLYASYWPNSLGIFYWFSTIHLGYEMGDEFKVMGMAAHGKPIYVDVLKTMICVDSNGCLEFHTNEYFGRKDIESIHGHYSFGFREKFYELIPERKPENEILQVHYDFAASLQKFTEDLGEEIARIAVKKTGFSQIALSGGLALNGLMNEKIRKSDFCSSIFIYPAAGDDGGAVGAAQYVVFEKSKIKPKRIHTSFYGEDYNNEEIESVILSLKLKYEKPVSIHKNIALAVSEGKIVARFYSKSEFGPRALGHRSILADPRKNEMKDILNERIKHREMFRPFAPACMKEFVTEFFDINGDADFMNLIVNAKPESKQRVPAVVHVDNTARVQTVGKSENIDFYKTLNEFYLLTGIPIMINTSFNVNGEAIVETPLDAIESFGHMDIDFLAIGDYWIEKTANKTRFPVMTDSELIARRKERFKEKHKNLLKLYDLNNFEFSEPMNLLKNIENIKKLNIILEQKTSVRSSLLTKLIRFLKNK